MQGVIFDLGATLIQYQSDGTWEEVLAEGIEALLRYLHEAGVSLESPRFDSRFRQALESSFAEREVDHLERTTEAILGQTLSEFGHRSLKGELIDEALERFYAVSEAHWTPMPGVYKVLDELQQSGYRLGLVSNAANVANVQRLIDQASLRGYFDPIVISAALGVRKPAKEIFEPVLSAWKIPARQIVMIGDTLAADVLGAQRLGMHSIWLTSRAETSENLAHRDRIIPEAVAERLDEVPALIRSMAV